MFSDVGGYDLHDYPTRFAWFWIFVVTICMDMALSEHGSGAISRGICMDFVWKWYGPGTVPEPFPMVGAWNSYENGMVQARFLILAYDFLTVAYHFLTVADDLLFSALPTACCLTKNTFY